MNALNVVLIALSGVLLAAVIFFIAAIKVKDAIIARKIKDCETLDKYAPPEPIVFFGDSLTDFYPVYEFLHDDRIVNRGVAGDTVDDAMERLDSVLALKPKAVFLLIGINDMIRGGNAEAERLAEKIIFLAEKIRRKTDLKIISLYPVCRKKCFISPFVIRKANSRTVAHVNAILKKYASRRGVDYIDVYSSLIDYRGELKEDCTVEGLHLSGRGYEAVTRVIAPYLKAIKSD